MDRRRFVKSAGLGTAGLLLNSVVLNGQNEQTLQSVILPQTAWGRVWIRWTQRECCPQEPCSHMVWQFPGVLVRV